MRTINVFDKCEMAHEYDNAMSFRGTLQQNGYHPIPLGDKGIQCTKWPTYVHGPDCPRTWEKGGTSWPLLGTGVLIKDGLVAIDVDINHESVSCIMKAIINEKVGTNHLIHRTSGKNSFTTFVRVDGVGHFKNEPHKRLHSGTFLDGDNKLAVEIYAGDAVRFFGIGGPHTLTMGANGDYHIHREYEYLQGPNIRDVPFNELPLVNPLVLWDIIKESYDILNKRFPKQGKASKPRPARPRPPRKPAIPNGHPHLARSNDLACKILINHFKNNRPPPVSSRDDFRDLVYSIHSASCGTEYENELRELLIDWDVGSGYNGEAVKTLWRDADPNGPIRVGTAMKMLGLEKTRTTIRHDVVTKRTRLGKKKTTNVNRQGFDI